MIPTKINSKEAYDAVCQFLRLLHKCTNSKRVELFSMEFVDAFGDDWTECTECDYLKPDCQCYNEYNDYDYDWDDFENSKEEKAENETSPSK